MESKDQTEKWNKWTFICWGTLFGSPENFRSHAGKSQKCPKWQKRSMPHATAPVLPLFYLRRLSSTQFAFMNGFKPASPFSLLGSQSQILRISCKNTINPNAFKLPHFVKEKKTNEKVLPFFSLEIDPCIDVDSSMCPWNWPKAIFGIQLLWSPHFGLSCTSS